jgi:prevent-host-death family protein
MKEVGAYAAKTHLAELLDDVSRGESVKISRNGKAVAVLIPATGEQKIPASEAIAKLRHLRKNATLGGLSLQSLIAEGRK